MIEQILYPALIIGAIGLFFGAVLALASIIFKVETDERIEKVAEVLPGANCGGCGFAGCSAFAQAIVEKGAPVTACNLMTKEKAEQIGKIMGIEVGEVIQYFATVKCNGSCEKCQDKCELFGIDDCITAASLGTGPKNCEYGCMGLGSCVKVCDEHGISIRDGIAFIDSESCIGCGKCVNVCPKKLIELVPRKRTAIVKCVSKDKGVVVKNLCDAGCIGCKICEKKCPKQAITVSDNLASIDYSLCVGCGICAKECPRGIIITSK